MQAKKEVCGPISQLGLQRPDRDHRSIVPVTVPSPWSGPVLYEGQRSEGTDVQTAQWTE